MELNTMRDGIGRQPDTQASCSEVAAPCIPKREFYPESSYDLLLLWC